MMLEIRLSTHSVPKVRGFNRMAPHIPSVMCFKGTVHPMIRLIPALSKKFTSHERRVNRPACNKPVKDKKRLNVSPIRILILLPIFFIAIVVSVCAIAFII